MPYAMLYAICHAIYMLYAICYMLCYVTMAPWMDPMPRSSTGATRNGSPDGSNATILVTVIKNSRGCSRARSAGAAARDPCGDFTVGLFNTSIRTL